MGASRALFLALCVAASTAGCAVAPFSAATRGPARRDAPRQESELPAAPYSYSDLYAILQGVRADLREGEVVRARQRLADVMPGVDPVAGDVDLVAELQRLVDRIAVLCPAAVAANPPR